MTVSLLKQIALGLWGIVPGNYSGITHIHSNVYAVVDDKENVDGFRYLTLDIDSVSGKVRNAVMTEPKDNAMRREKMDWKQRDCEGIAYCPDRGTVFVSGEEDQRILEYNLDGSPTGQELQIPDIMQRDKIAENLGFEALCYDESSKLFWTTTESPLPADYIPAGNEASTALRLVSFDTNMKQVSTYFYNMDTRMTKRGKKCAVHGVSSMLALGDGRLIVMEREVSIPKRKIGTWCRMKLYIVNPSQETPGSLSTPMSEVTEQQFLQKELLCQFTTRLRIGKISLSNYEGMCLGPELADGSKTIIMIADSGGGVGNAIYHLKDNIKVLVLR